MIGGMRKAMMQGCTFGEMVAKMDAIRGDRTWLNIESCDGTTRRASKAAKLARKMTVLARKMDGENK